MQALDEARLGYFSDQLALLANEPVPSFRVSVANLSTGPAMLLVGSPSLPTMTCSPIVLATPYLARITRAMACATMVEAVTEPTGTERLYYLTGSLLAHQDALYFQTMSFLPATRDQELRLHSFDASLTRRWVSTLVPLAVRPPGVQDGVMPVRVLAKHSTVVAVWAIGGNWIEGVRSPEGLTVSCPALSGSSSSMLITLHDAENGRLRWGVCLPGEVNGVSRFRGFEQSALSGVTLLVPGQASNLGPSPGTGALSFGTHTLPVSTVAGYLLALRLPLE